MKRIYITFSGSAYDPTTARIVADAPRFGVDEVRVYDDHWLVEQEFYAENIWLWSTPRDRVPPHHGYPRGFGWFCWKPYVIMHALEHSDPGDIILYTDADTYPIQPLGVLFDECERIGGMMLFEAMGCPHNEWCKRDCFIVMGQDEERWRNVPHAVARFMLFKNGPWRNRQFLMEWLAYCLNPLAQTFEPSVILPEYPGLAEHRTEQAIFTNLAHKYGAKLYREACQYGNSSMTGQDLYPQLFVQEGCARERTLNGSRYRNIA